MNKPALLVQVDPQRNELLVDTRLIAEQPGTPRPRSLIALVDSHRADFDDDTTDVPSGAHINGCVGVRPSVDDIEAVGDVADLDDAEQQVVGLPSAQPVPRLFVLA
jgi:hypothetical protein